MKLRQPVSVCHIVSLMVKMMLWYLVAGALVSTVSLGGTSGAFGFPPFEAGSRVSKRQTAPADPLTDILTGQIAPNCTGEDEIVFVCPLFARCYHLPTGLVCVCGDPGSGGLCPGDYDECKRETHTCQAGNTCQNTFGSYVCRCGRGFQNGATATTCVDIDECSDSQLPCHASSSCTNTEGSFTCQCLPGFLGDGFNCEDENECFEEMAGCHMNAVCTNTEGSYRCRCANGFVGDGRECNRPVGEPTTMKSVGPTTEAFPGTLTSEARRATQTATGPPIEAGTHAHNRERFTSASQEAEHLPPRHSLGQIGDEGGGSKQNHDDGGSQQEDFDVDSSQSSD